MSLIQIMKDRVQTSRDNMQQRCVMLSPRWRASHPS